MRIIYEDFALGIKCAWRDKKRLIFKDLDDVRYCTEDYFAENIALGVLNDLVVNGYIRVKNLKIM